MAVRYDKKFMAEINRVINAYNRKIVRLSKSGEDYILPDKFSKEAFQQMKATSRTRADVRNRLKDLQSFTARGGEKTINIGRANIPRYKYQNIKRYRRRLGQITSRKMRELESRHPISGATEDPFTFSQYGTQEYLTLKAKRVNLLLKDLAEMSSSELDEYFNKLLANTLPKNLDLWQDNFIAILQDTALSYGYDTDRLDTIIEKLSLLSPEEFDDLSFISRNIKAVIYSYKALEDINTAKELSAVSNDVIANLDTIYENIDDIISMYING